MSIWLMYFIVLLSGLQIALHNITVILAMGLTISGAIFGVATFFAIVEREWEKPLGKALKKAWKYFKIVLIIEIILIITRIFVPTTQQAAAIYFVPKVINNKQTQKMPDKIVILANAWMDKKLKGIKKST